MAASVRLAPPQEDPHLALFFRAFLAEQFTECEKLLAEHPSLRQIRSLALRLLKQAAFEGKVTLSEWTVRTLHVAEEEAQVAFEYAGAFGHPSLCEWWLHHTSHITNQVVERAFLAAAHRGKFTCCKWLKENTLSITDSIIKRAEREASERGHQGLQEWLTPPKMGLQEIKAAYEEDR